MNSNQMILKYLFVSVSVILLLTLGIMGTSAESDNPANVSDSIGTAFTYQGRLKDGDEPANGKYNFRFYLWADQSKTSLLGTYPDTGTIEAEVVDGYFTVLLDFGVGIFEGDERWLEIEVNGTLLSPLQPITPSPYAIHAQTTSWSGLTDVPTGFTDGVDNNTTYSAGNQLQLSGTTFNVLEGSGSGLDADLLDGFNSSAFADSSHTHWGESWSGSDTGLTLINNSTTGYGVYGRTTASSGTTYGVYGRSNSTEGIGVAGYSTAGSGITYGVYGRSLSPTGRGVYGWSSVTGNYAQYGVYGRSDANQGRGVFGYATATSGENYGVRGVTESPDGYGVYGWNTSTGGVAGYFSGKLHAESDSVLYSTLVENKGTGDGLRALTHTSSGNDWAAVFAYNSGTSPAIFANTLSGTYSGYFRDDIYVEGNCVGCSVAYIAQNSGSVSLETGDLVSALGVKDPLTGDQQYILSVGLASEGSPGVIGVVLSSAVIVESEKDGQLSQSAQAGDGSAKPGDYLFILVQGLAEVKVDPSLEIQPGQRLTASAAAGTARPLRTESLNGMTVTEGAPVIGIALASPQADSTTIPVFVTLH